MRVYPFAVLLCACAPLPARVVSTAPRPVRATAAVAARTSAPTAVAAPVEPALAEVVQMAVTAARGVSPERVVSLAKRARLSGLAPQLRISAERGLQQDLSSTTTTQLDRRNAAVGDDLSFSASLTFALDRLVFAADEVRLLSVERWLAGDQRKLVADVIKLYYQRRRLVRERALSTAADGELDDSIAELEGLLDGATAGGFTAALSAPSSAP